ncbi:MAG TPA: ATP-binding protein [Chloroflexia bacterium]|nr:ATP-binding protein [Chloroflexia bacterium]
MERVDKILAGLSIPINTSPGNTPIYSARSEVCPTCGGAGYLRMDVPVGHPNFGRTFPCECKLRELSERTHNGMERLSNLDAFADKTFESFDPAINGLREAFLRARDYANNPDGWLVLMGNFGCGKTHLAAAIANAAMARGLQTYFAIAPDLLDHLRSAYAPTSESTYDERFESVRTVPLLVIDDLGTENTTPWAREKLFQIFNHRYNYHLPTVVTTNVDMDNLDPRIASRICDQQLCDHVFIKAADFRLRGTQPRPRETGARDGRPAMPRRLPPR